MALVNDLRFNFSISQRATPKQLYKAYHQVIGSFHLMKQLKPKAINTFNISKLSFNQGTNTDDFSTHTEDECINNEVNQDQMVKIVNDHNYR